MVEVNSSSFVISVNRCYSGGAFRGERSRRGFLFRISSPETPPFYGASVAFQRKELVERTQSERQMPPSGCENMCPVKNMQGGKWQD